MPDRLNKRMTTAVRAALIALLCCSSAMTLAASRHAGGPDDAIDRAAEDVDRAIERAARDVADAQERAARDATDTAERTAEIEQRYIEDQAKAAADAASDPDKAAEDLADAEEDRLRELEDLAEDGSNSGSGSDSSGSGSDDSDNSGSGSDSDDSDDGSTPMRDVAREESPEFDPRGFPVRRGEVVALDFGEAGLARASSEGFRIIARDRLETLTGSITRLETPIGIAPEAALAKLRAIEPRATFDYTHYYGLQLVPQATARQGSGKLRRRAGQLTIGMIDTGVAPHPALSSTAVTQRRFGSAGDKTLQTGHGTAIASILASEGTRRLLVADVFRGSARSPFTSADAIAQSLEWMSASGITVVNISLAGPRNAILDRLIERAIARGMVIVAAAGNGGPAAPPAYPAALASVVAVTAVDGQSRVYRYANQGHYIAVAARGVDEPAAASGGGVALYSGTSIATPRIAAWMARCLTGTAASVALCRTRLRHAARDAGVPGYDPVYGWGIVGRD